MSRTPRPMLPASCEGRPEAVRMWWISAAVGGLAVGAGDGGHAGDDREPAPVRQPQRAEEQADVVVHRHPGLERGQHHAVRRGVEMRDARRDHERGAALDRARRREVGGREALACCPRAGLLPVVPAQRLGAPRPERARGGGEARAAEAEDGDARALVAEDGDHPSSFVLATRCNMAPPTVPSATSTSPTRIGVAAMARRKVIRVRAQSAC